METFTNEMNNISHIIKRLFGVLLGSILIAVAYNALLIPYGLLAGGMGGLALVGEYVFNLPVHIGFLLLNIPVFIWGIKELDKEFIFYSLICAILITVALPYSKQFVVVPELDIFLASIYSGILSGLGIGIVFKFGASTGGNDIISVIMKQKKNISIGQFLIYFNIMVLCLSLYFFDLKIALYTAISMWVSGKIVDVVIDGVNRDKSVTIISDNNPLIAEQIMKELHRGVTYLNGEGAFSGNRKIVINCVLNHFEIAKIKRIVLKVDPNAFMYVTEIKEVLGRGFTLENKIESQEQIPKL